MAIDSRNTSYGFYGTFRDNQQSAGRRLSDAELKKAFQQAIDEIVRRFGVKDDVARDFLDSTSGRHLADAITSFEGKVKSFPSWLPQEFNRWKKSYDPADYQLSDADPVASLRARHAVHFGAGSATQLADAPVQLASGDLSNGKLREAAQALNAVKNEIRGVFTSGQKVDPRQYSRAIDAIDQALASLGEAGSAISKLLV